MFSYVRDYSIKDENYSLAIAFTIPVLAAVIAFITYSLSGHGFDSAIIFSSLSLFNLLRQPLLFLPRALSAISDAQSAMQRLSILYSAETRTDDAFEVDPSIEEGLLVKNACFAWEESTAELKAKDGKKGKNKGAKAKKPQDEKPEILSTAPFVIRDMNLSIPRGQLCAIVGPVGSGKVIIFSLPSDDGLTIFYSLPYSKASSEKCGPHRVQ